MTQPTKLYYVIRDAGDGSASLLLFADVDARDRYFELCGEEGDLSEGGGVIDLTTVFTTAYNKAMTVADVDAEYQ